MIILDAGCGPGRYVGSLNRYNPAKLLYRFWQRYNK